MYEVLVLIIREVFFLKVKFISLNIFWEGVLEGYLEQEGFTQ